VLASALSVEPAARPDMRTFWQALLASV